MDIIKVLLCLYIFCIVGTQGQISSSIVAILSGCPCRDEVGCLIDQKFVCVNLENLGKCDSDVVGITECRPCLQANLTWCPMNFSDVDSAICIATTSAGCNGLQSVLPNLFNADPVENVDNCPKKKLCPDCGKPGKEKVDAKILVCRKSGSALEQTLRIPPLLLPYYLSSGNVILGPCGNRQGQHKNKRGDGDGGGDDDHDDHEL